MVINLILFIAIFCASATTAGASPTTVSETDCSTLLRSRSARSAEALIEEANFIHSIWQNSNSYRTRYKAMKFEDGTTVTDIQAYIRSRSIPAEYRLYYRRNVKGFYEEDIKRIPNQFLAFNNSKENLDGAESYLRHLILLNGRQPERTSFAIAMIEDSLRAIHREWYARNISWTKPFGEPKTYEDAGVEKQYNGALQFYKIAERHGLLQNKIWKTAFSQLIKKLARQKFEPYQSMSLPQAYLAMTEKTGVKPAIAGDAHVAQFYISRMQSYATAMPTNREQEPQAVENFLQSYFPNLNSEHPIAIKSPPVPPGTEARVYLIVDPVGDREVIAVLKIQRGVGGLDEIISNLAAENQITSTSEFTPVKTLAFGRLKGNDYFILQQAARTSEADHFFALDSAQRRRMVRKVAKSLANLHGPMQILDEAQASALGGDLTSFRGNCFYDLRMLTRFLPGGDRDVLSPAIAQGLLRAEIAQVLFAQVEDLSAQYTNYVELQPHLLSPTVIHGDFHGGNLFLNPNDDRAMLIDYGGATWFFGKKIGTGDRGNDLGRMLGNIVVEGTKQRLSQREISIMVSELLTRYRHAARVPLDSVQERALNVSAAFYMNRFLAVNAADSTAKKFKPIEGDNLTALHQRLYANWLFILNDLALVRPMAVRRSS